MEIGSRVHNGHRQIVRAFAVGLVAVLLTIKHLLLAASVQILVVDYRSSPQLSLTLGLMVEIKVK